MACGRGVSTRQRVALLHSLHANEVHTDAFWEVYFIHVEKKNLKTKKILLIVDCS